MGSICREALLNISADQAWKAIREVGLADRLFADVLVDCRLDGDVRTVTFADGLVVRERIIDVDDEHRRLAYSAIEGTPMTHHNASMQIVPDGDDRCQFSWIADFLPHDFLDTMLPLMERGVLALKSSLEDPAFTKGDTAA